MYADRLTRVPMAAGDIIDVVSDYEMEEAQVRRKGKVLTPEAYLLKLLLGSIDPTYDSFD